MPYLVIKDVTVPNEAGEAYTHLAGTVLSDFEVREHVRNRLAAGDVHLRSLLEPLSAEEARHYRAKATAAERMRYIADRAVEAPWDDYVGLHPDEILERLRNSTDPHEIQRVRDYERAGLNRRVIVEFTAPIEREPFVGYSELGIRETLEKMSLLDDKAVQEIIAYEALHRKRPAILEYERETYEQPKPADQEDVPVAA